MKEFDQRCFHEAASVAHGEESSCPDLRLPAPVLERSVLVQELDSSCRSRTAPAWNRAPEVGSLVAPFLATTMDQPRRRARFRGCESGRSRAMISGSGLR